MYMVRADPTYVSRKSPHLKSRTCLVCIGLASLDCGGVLYISALCVNGCSGKPCLWSTIFLPCVWMCCPASPVCGGVLLYFRHMCVNVLSGKPYLWGRATIFPPYVCECAFLASLICGGVLLYFRPVCECVVRQALFEGKCYYISTLCVWMCCPGKPCLWGSATIFPPCVWMCCSGWPYPWSNLYLWHLCPWCCSFSFLKLQHSPLQRCQHPASAGHTWNVVRVGC